MDYIDILNSIKNSEGGLVTVMLLDHNICNYNFLKSLYQELKKEYNIEYDNYNIKNINVKTVVFIDILKIPRVNNSIGNRSILFRSLIGNENVIIIAIKHVNSALTPSSLYGGEEIYTSNIVFSIKDKKLTVVKSRYTEFHNNELLDISNISTLVRKMKLNKIIKNNI